jgi:AmmeMemoRadiSam system protein A
MSSGSEAMQPGGAIDGSLLLRLAREAIALALRAPLPVGRVGEEPLDAPWLRADGACFVTLSLDGRLRGCIGSVKARRPLLDDVRSNARAAALSDPRFPPLQPAELAAVQIEVSVLSPPAPLLVPPGASEAEVLAALRPGIDGLILENPYGGYDAHATFLPQVWESLPAPPDFLAHLKEKAGLSPDFWSSALRFQRYTVDSWSEAPH